MTPDQRDAARYRKLRALNCHDSPLCVVANPKEAVKLGHDCPSGDRLDAAIDALEPLAIATAPRMHTDAQFWRLLAAWRDSEPGHASDAAGRAIEVHVQGLLDAARAALPVAQGGGTVAIEPHHFSWQQRGPYCVVGMCACGWSSTANTPANLRNNYLKHVGGDT